MDSNQWFADRFSPAELRFSSCSPPHPETMRVVEGALRAVWVVALETAAGRKDCENIFVEAEC